MKKLLFAGIAVMLASVSLPSYAQDYNRVGASYELETWFGDDENTNLNGFGVNYIHGFRLSKKVPIYLETGVKVSMGFHHDSYYDGIIIVTSPYPPGQGYNPKVELAADITKLSFSIPFNVAYKANLGNNLSIVPYLGLNFKLNALAQLKASVKIDGDKIGSETINFLKGDDEGYGAANIFQLGWHLGVGFNYSRIYAGLSYGTDFVRFAEDTNSSTFNITVGYNF